MPHPKTHHERMEFAFNSDARTTTVRLALVLICHHAGDDGIYRGGPESIAPMLGRRGTRNRIGVARRAIRELTDHAYIENVEPWGTPPIYRIRFEREQDRGLVQD